MKPDFKADARNLLDELNAEIDDGIRLLMLKNALEDLYGEAYKRSKLHDFRCAALAGMCARNWAESDHDAVVIMANKRALIMLALTEEDEKNDTDYNTCSNGT